MVMRKAGQALHGISRIGCNSAGERNSLLTLSCTTDSTYDWTHHPISYFKRF